MNKSHFTDYQDVILSCIFSLTGQIISMLFDIEYFGKSELWCDVLCAI